ncbi:hypothetical protein LX87_05106 [Larkinella arboricola]|uniref:Uncharacterized protein n=1 Tax=Larkinella arboricola TaxID=643671 RepID=A0A327WNM8_LARAB|nr:hypothetical protein [Larkinella arboricola]RAJ92142.1 hypothetical protein LX87_05106 [Larkinella arboricola]
MEIKLSDIQERLLDIRTTMDEHAASNQLLDLHTLGQIKVQILDLLTVTELLIVTNQTTDSSSPNGQA